MVENCEKPQNSEEAAENVDNGYFGAVVHLDCVDLEACKKWVSEFSDSSLCTWRVRRTYPGGRRGLVCRMDYVCHHSRFNKLHEKRQKTKDTDCRATLTIKVD